MRQKARLGVSYSHLNKHRLINSLEGWIDETGLWHRNTRTGLPPKISRLLPGSDNGRLLAQGERHFTRVSRPSTYEVVSLGNSERADRFNCVSKTSLILSANPQCRNSCDPHAFFKGEKSWETSPRKSTARTLKYIRRQYLTLYATLRDVVNQTAKSLILSPTCLLKQNQQT
jgi:hypothetical protein